MTESTKHRGPEPYYVGGHCTDCHLNASRCDCDRRCPCGKYYRPRRGEKSCHVLTERKT